ncbi:MAG: hypothetical protein LBI70_03460 [Rickettsiales bacterium]|jgi:hypothetical protein|nr:hypothetical protein [Rickettsiales bacterium]
MESSKIKEKLKLKKLDRPSIFENSRHAKSSSIVLEYVFFAAMMLLVLYSVVTTKDIPENTATLLRWIGVIVIFGVEGYKINERICDIRSDKLKILSSGE